MKLTTLNNIFIFECSFFEKDIAKKAGFKWDSELKNWYTSTAIIAKKLIEYADDNALDKIAESEKEIQQSFAADCDCEIPAPNDCKYLGYQKAGIAYAHMREITLIADEMGLGKTVQAIGLINLEKPKKILIICPASLKLNWKRELEKWLVSKYTIEIVNKNISFEFDITIINYDLLKKHKQQLDSIRWDLLICDESHYLKNFKSIRTQQVFGGKEIKKINAKKSLFLTGTPILNRPIELFPLLKYAKITTNWMHYVKKYCNAIQTDFGWDISGASNTIELGEILREKIMIRRQKNQVLKELPNKIRQIIPLTPPKYAIKNIATECKTASRLEEIRKQILFFKKNNISNYEEQYKKLQQEFQIAFADIACIRHENAISKIDDIVNAAMDFLEQDDCLIIFAHHQDVVKQISDKLNTAKITTSIYTGATNQDERQQLIDDFQSGKTQVFVATIGAAGVGITLTRASTIFFCELEWTPAAMQQAEDRVHRIGQNRIVHIIYYIYEGTIDEMLAKTLHDKEIVINNIMQ